MSTACVDHKYLGIEAIHEYYEAQCVLVVFGGFDHRGASLLIQITNYYLIYWNKLAKLGNNYAWNVWGFMFSTWRWGPEIHSSSENLAGENFHPIVPIMNLHLVVVKVLVITHHHGLPFLVQPIGTGRMKELWICNPFLSLEISIAMKKKLLLMRFMMPFRTKTNSNWRCETFRSIPWLESRRL